MAVAVQLDLRGGTLEQYGQVIEKTGFEKGGPVVRGACSTGSRRPTVGIPVTDVRESRGALDAFAQEKIGPITEEAGVPNRPEIRFFAVHNYLTAG